MARIPLNLCLKCGAAIDAASAPGAPRAEPKDGDASLCMYCGDAMIFRADGSLRPPTPAESAQLDADAGVRRLRLAIAFAGFKPPSEEGTA